MDFKKKAGLALALAAIFTTGGADMALADNVTLAPGASSEEGQDIIVGSGPITQTAAQVITIAGGNNFIDSTGAPAPGLVDVNGGTVVLSGSNTLDGGLKLGTDGTATTGNVNGSYTASVLEGGAKTTINVGSDASDGKGTLIVGEADLSGATVFADPAFTAKAYDPSQVTFERFYDTGITTNDPNETAIDGALVAGRNSTITVADSNNTWINNIIANTGKWTADAGVTGLTAAFGSRGAQYLLADTVFGVIEVDGGLTSANFLTKSKADSSTSADFFAANRSLTAIDLTGVSETVGAFRGIDTSDASTDIASVTIGDFYAGDVVNAAAGQGAALYLDNANVSGNGKYTIFANVTDSTGITINNAVVTTGANLNEAAMGGHWFAENLIFSNGMLTGSWSIADGASGDNLVLTVAKTKDAQDVFGAMSNGLATLVDDLYDAGENANALDATKLDSGLGNANTGYTNNVGIQFVSRATSGSYITDRTEAVSVLEGAAQIAVAGGVPYITSNVISKISGLIVDRNNLLNDTQPAYGNEPGQFGLWVTPFYSMGDVDGMDAGSFQNGFELNYGGAAFGMDYNINESFRLGLALNLGSGDTDSDDGDSDFSRTENDFDFFGGSLYGSYTNGSFGLTGDLGYTGVDNDVEQRLPSSLGMGGGLHSDVDSDAFTIGLTGKYRFAASDNFNIAPHLGLRYTKISTDDTTVKLTGGGRVFDTDTEDMNLFQIPLGVEFSGNVVTDGGWTVTPKADLGVLFTMGDTDVDTRARIAGTSIRSGVMNADVVDSAAFTGTLGVKAAADNGLSLGLDYGILASGNQTDHQFSGMLRFEF